MVAILHGDMTHKYFGRTFSGDLNGKFFGIGNWMDKVRRQDENASGVPSFFAVINEIYFFTCSHKPCCTICSVNFLSFRSACDQKGPLAGVCAKSDNL